MTVIVSMVLYVFGLDSATGNLNKKCGETTCADNVKIDASGNIIVYDPQYNPRENPVYYKSPNVIVPNPNANDPPVPVPKPITASTTSNYVGVPSGTSSPAYQS